MDVGNGGGVGGGSNGGGGGGGSGGSGNDEKLAQFIAVTGVASEDIANHWLEVGEDAACRIFVLLSLLVQRFVCCVRKKSDDHGR